MKRLLIAAAASLAVLAGCATGPEISDEQRLALYRANAGEPVGSFHYFRTLQGWTPLGDEALTVWTRPNQAYLLELSGPCNGLEFTPAISITQMFGRVSAGFDKVLVLDDPAFNLPCRIREIRPVDVAGFEEARQELREQIRMVEREQAEGEAQPDESEAVSDGGT